MKIKEVMRYRFLVKGLQCQTVDELLYDPEICTEFFTKQGNLRKGWVATNKL